jgi:hypothetical protein
MLNIDIKDLLLKIAHDNDLVSFKNIGRKKNGKVYAVSISFKNEQLKEKRFSGKFEKESLNTALEALKATSSFNFFMDNGKVIIY